MMALADKTSRISVSLPESLLAEYDQLISECGFDNRSKAISELISQRITEYRQETEQGIMAGTINLVYDRSVNGVQKKIDDLQYQYIDEVISALNVNLTRNKILSVILVQGPAKQLKMIANDMINLRGVITGRLLVSSAIMPQVHPLP